MSPLLALPCPQPSESYVTMRPQARGPEELTLQDVWSPESVSVCRAVEKQSADSGRGGIKFDFWLSAGHSATEWPPC